jgi:hypothetical protein
MGTRKECRETLAGLFSALTFTGGVYEYLPMNLNGATKVLAVYSDTSRHEIISGGFGNNFYRFNLDVLVKRAGAGVQDDLDDLHENVRSVIRAAVGNAAWNEITIEEDSEGLFAEIAGIPYRVEQHKVLIKVSST